MVNCTHHLTSSQILWLLENIFNSSPPSAAYMRQWTGSSLVQVMACRLFGAAPLSEPILAYCQLDSSLGTYFSEILIRILSFSFMKMQLKMLSAKMAAILSWGRWVNHSSTSPINIWDIKLVHTVPTDALAHYSTKPLAGTVVTMNINMTLLESLAFNDFEYTFAFHFSKSTFVMSLP